MRKSDQDMSVNPVISIEGLNKIYRLYDHRMDRLKESFHPLRKRYYQEFHALTDINFSVSAGQTVGILGKNGSGKSTLLSLVAKVLTPSSGQVEVNGRVSALLELGTGFNPDFTGRENIFFFGTVHGYTRDQIQDKMDAIIDFAEIGAFIDQPVKVYSSGMFVRLAFAVSINIDPEILIVDEALAVGDAYFQVKSMSRMRQFKDAGKTALFVSHDVNAIKVLCDYAILLDGGRIIDQGDPAAVVDFYSSMIASDVHQSDTRVHISRKLDAEAASQDKQDTGEPSSGKSLHGFDTGETELLSFRVHNQKGEAASFVTSEEPVQARFELKANKDLDQPHFSVMVRDRFGISIFETSTYFMGRHPPAMRAGQVVKGTFSLPFNLSAGNYSLSFSANNRGYGGNLFEEYLILVHDIVVLQVLQNPAAILYHGVFNMHPEFSASLSDNLEHAEHD